MRLRSFGLLKGFYKILIFLAILSPILFIIVLIISAYTEGIVGIVQRIYIPVLMFWLIITANGIRTGILIPQNDN